jgi:quercetin dioxygenase-like cupin family protein
MLDPLPSPGLRLPPLAPATLTDIAVGLARTAGLWMDRLGERPSLRYGLRLVAAAEYDAWLLCWPPRSNVRPHDHGDSGGAFTVVEGQLLEVRWHGTLRRSRLVTPGEVIAIERGVVHDVIADGSDTALSVHVYSPPLSAMGFYDETGTIMLDRQPVEEGGIAAATARSLHPAGSR